MDNLRRFIVVFAAMFFLATAVCGFMLVQHYSDAQGDQVADLQVSAPTYDPNAESGTTDVFRENILCMIGDSGQGVPELMFLVNVDGVTGNVSYLFIPQNMKYAIAQSKEVGTFGEYFGRYAWNTADKATALLSSFLDVNVKYYFTMTTADFGKLISTFSSEDQGVEFEVPVDLEYASDALEISIPAGKQYLKGEDAASFIRFVQTTDGVYSAEMLPYYDGTDVKRIAQVQKFFDAFMTQKFTDATTDVYRENFSELLYPYFAKGNTNLTGTALDRIESVVAALRQDQIHYYMLNGKTLFNQKAYLEYNNTMQNLTVEASVSNVKAEDVLTSRFKTGQ